MKLIDSLRPDNCAWYYEYMRENKPVLIVFEIDERTAGLLCGLRKGDEIEVVFVADSRNGLSAKFDLEGNCTGELGMRMLAWRDWEGAWRVLDPRVSALLPTVDTYAEGD